MTQENPMRYESYAYDRDHYQMDPDLRDVLAWCSTVGEERNARLHAIGKIGGGRAYKIAAHVDREAQPRLIMHDLDGRRVDRVELCPDHAELLKELAVINRPPYEEGSWQEHFVYGYLIADPGLYCSLIVTNQTVYALFKYAPELHEWIEPLLSGDSWGATWMTETQGGSDLGANETTAVRDGEIWRLQGTEKYFASNAGLADAALVTARPEGAAQGPKGLALFLVPRLDRSGSLNFLIRRLKSKSGTRAVPTAEVELHGSEAFLIGEAARGIYYTLETLTVSRLANAIGAVGLARKAQFEAVLRSNRREAFGSLLREHPLMRRDLTDICVRTTGSLVLAFHGIELFDAAWQAEPPYTPEYHYARFFSHLIKNRTAEHAAYVTRLAMEVFGGLGFMDESPLPRLHREALVTSIWEGTSNIQALDMLEVMQKKGAHEMFLDAFSEKRDDELAERALQVVRAGLAELEGKSAAEAQWGAKELLRSLADAATVMLLLDLAASAGERYRKIAELYAQRFLERSEYPSWALASKDIWLPESILSA
jgi:alkylation response protein AidB-like acyl-CoA dehydrogenase